MRRSAAPSRVLEHPNKRDRIIAPSTYEYSPRNPSTPVTSSQCDAENISAPVDSTVAYFEVVFAKASAKKHKKWEGDGFVLINGRTVSLTNESGKTIASTCSHKLTYLSALEEGSLLRIGSYEAELLTSITAATYGERTGKSVTTNSMSLDVENTGAPEESKNARNCASNVDPHTPALPRPSPVTVFSKDVVHLPGALLMPRPPDACVWTQNPEGLPIVDVALEPRFTSRLRPHQKEGLVFLYQCIMGFSCPSSPSNLLSTVLSDATEPSQTGPIYGCILADEMGLGKTVQTIALLWLLFKQGPYGGRPVIRRCLIVTPSTLIQNWAKEFTKWLGRERLPFYCVGQNATIKNYMSQPNPPPVIILSYEMLLQHSAEVQSIPNLDMVVCDEGHRLKNFGIHTSLALRQLPCRRRMIITGTPVQNNLDELWSLAEFCAPGRLATSQEAFRREFIHRRPMQADQSSDSDEEDTPRLKLSSLLSTFLLRRTTEVLRPELNSKNEFIVFCRPSSLQAKLETVLTRWVQRELDLGQLPPDASVDLSDEDDENRENNPPFRSEGRTKETGDWVLCTVTAFRKLHNHPNLLWHFLTPSLKTTSKQSGSKLVSGPRLPNSLTSELLEILRDSPASTDHNEMWNADLVSTSGKLTVLDHMLRQLFGRSSERPGTTGLKSFTKNVSKHRLVLVSNFTQTLDLLEKVCFRITGQHPLRLDGQTPNKRRSEIVERLNDPNSCESILLLSSRAGGTGLNLVGADHLILYDMDWNPANDAQAMARIWRPGQSRPVRLYRLVTAGGLEERIFQRQAAKLALSHDVLLDHALPTKESQSTSKRTGVLTREELRDLFQTPPPYGSLWTHQLIACTCDSTDRSPSPSLSDESSQTHSQEDTLSDSDVRPCQLGFSSVDNSKVRQKSDQHQVKSMSEALAFLLDWKHSLSTSAVAELNDPLLFSSSTNNQDTLDLPISAVFSLTTDAAETSPLVSTTST